MFDIERPLVDGRLAAIECMPLDSLLMRDSVVAGSNSAFEFLTVSV
jgi:hypothetical protein